MVGLKIFVNTLFIISSVVVRRADGSCVQIGTEHLVKNAFPLFVNGIADLVNTSDPLTADTIIGNLPTIKYDLRNAKLAGIKTCAVVALNICEDTSTFDFHMECPTLEYNSDYNLIGYLGDLEVEGEGKLKVICDDYILKFEGIFKKILGKDNKKHVRIEKYFLDAEPVGKVQLHFENLFGGDKERSDAVHKFLNENWKVMDRVLRAPVINTLMDTFIDNLNDYMAIVPFEEIFPNL